MKAGVGYGAVTVAAAGSRAMTANVAQSFSLGGLAPQTAYDVYLVVQDGTPTLSAVSGPLRFSTLAAPVRSVTGAAPGAGSVTASFTGGSASCGYASTQFQTAAALGGSLPAGYSFPQGVFGFTSTDCGSGATLSFTLSYAQSFPAGTQYFKYNGSSWVAYPATISGNQITFTVTDNGAGDSNPAAGFLTDPGGPGVPVVASAAQPIPTLSDYALALLALLTASLAGRRLVRHPRGGQGRASARG